jgi:hypothetical protein
MGGPHETPEVIKEREKLAKKIKDFMRDNLFTEKRLGDICSISRRTVQMIKSGKVTPHQDTLDKLENLFAKYRKEGK